MKGKFLFVDVVNNRNPKRGNSECNISEIPNQILYFSRLIVSLTGVLDTHARKYQIKFCISLA